MRFLKRYRHDNDPRWRCCGCCHVQTGTICLGAYNLILQMMAMCVIFFAIAHPEALFEPDKFSPSSSSVIGQISIDKTNSAGVLKSSSPPDPNLPTPLPRRRTFDDRLSSDDESTIDEIKMQKIFYSKSEMLFYTHKRIQSGDAHLALALVFGLFTITAMLVYGAVKSRPLYLLPFFCFQVFDFVVACLTALGHYSWLPNLREAIETNRDFPFREQLLQMNAQWIALFISVMYITVLMAKAYFIGVVWACYQYLHARNAGIFSYTDDGDGILRDAELLLPPDYENATKLPPVYQGPPPPYHQA